MKKSLYEESIASLKAIPGQAAKASAVMAIPLACTALLYTHNQTTAAEFSMGATVVIGVATVANDEYKRINKKKDS
jgi:hypothetical protein